MKKQGTIYTILFTFAVCFIFVLLLSLANEGTKKTVEQNGLFVRQRSVLNAFGIPWTTRQEVFDLYAERITEESVAGQTVYKTVIDGKSAYAQVFSGSGLWGTITGVLAMNEDFSRIEGIEIISHNETPGLGGRIDEKWFKEQFRHERLPSGTLTVRVQGSAGGDADLTNGIVDAVSGATRTSQSMEIMINKEIVNLKTILGGTK